MAFASAISSPEGIPIVMGTKKVTWGTYTSTGGSTGGNIDTGLREVDSIVLQPKGAAAAASAPAVNETLPIAGSAITIVTVANEVGYWYAMGE